MERSRYNKMVSSRRTGKGDPFVIMTGLWPLILSVGLQAVCSSGTGSKAGSVNGTSLYRLNTSDSVMVSHANITGVSLVNVTTRKVPTSHGTSSFSTKAPKNLAKMNSMIVSHANITSVSLVSATTKKVPTGHGTSPLSNKAPKHPAKVNLRAINSYEQIVAWLSSLASKYSFVEVLDLGRTFENRSILILKIESQNNRSFGNGGTAWNGFSNHTEEPTKAIFLDGGTHSREQITVSVALSLIDKIVKAHEKNQSSPWTAVTWYIAPLVNPDGYEYSRTPKGRQWRKNRSSKSSAGCLGVDVNRNWNFHWGMESEREAKKDGEPLSKGFFSTVSWLFKQLMRPDHIVRQLSLLEPCTELYAGSAPFSEAESKLLSDFLVSVANQTSVTLWSAWSLHSMIGGQQLLYPYGYTTSPASDYDHLSRLASNMSAAMEIPNGRKYQHGSVADILYQTTGLQADWIYGHLGINQTFVMEMRDNYKKDPAILISMAFTELVEALGVLLSQL